MDWPRAAWRCRRAWHDRTVGRNWRGRCASGPVVALLSGPAAGVAGAADAAEDAGWPDADLMTLDVGGTSADIGVIRDGQPVLSSEEVVGEFPVLVPTVAVSSIGAGGGSIIWLDSTGSLKVGPRSVGADPGPACYGSGSLMPALTDAFLLAGLLTPGQRLGGKLALQPEPARAALETHRADAGLDAGANGGWRDPRSPPPCWRRRRRVCWRAVASMRRASAWWPLAARGRCWRR